VPELATIILGLGIVAVAVALAALAWTRWGHDRPLRKCIVLSILAHVLLGVYAATIHIMSAGAVEGDPPAMAISEILWLRADALGDELQPAANRSDNPAGAVPATADLPSHVDAKQDDAALDEPAKQEAVAEPATSDSKASEAPPPARNDPFSLPDSSAVTSADDSPRDESNERSAEDRAKDIGTGIALLPADESARKRTTTEAGDLEGRAGPREEGPPAAYGLRTGQERERAVRTRGGSAATEAAVASALDWLARAQSSDGRWDARLHGAGTSRTVAGRALEDVGRGADTGVTGLALLAYLGAGNTHREGPHRDAVSRGVDFLVRSQAADGNLGGGAETFSFMYCHAMATFALSECYALTGDRSLRQAVERAVDYSVAAQDSAGGGWRYQPGDRGDTSQHGWQVMALSSAALAGIDVPKAVFSRAGRFLDRVASGAEGGLAAYRPGEAPSRAMTAEALSCRIFLGLTSPKGTDEAVEYLLEELPGDGPDNVYSWYYTGLALSPLDDARWRRWNAALADRLVATQRRRGTQKGSWDPDPVWGRQGGRVYATAMSALCLEVYYRYLPLFVASAAADGSP
jgi:hypothetical protein